MKDLAVVLGTETVTVILDDTISVWPEHQHNLMQVTDPTSLNILSCRWPCCALVRSYKLANVTLPAQKPIVVSGIDVF